MKNIQLLTLFTIGFFTISGAQYAFAIEAIQAQVAETETTSSKDIFVVEERTLGVSPETGEGAALDGGEYEDIGIRAEATGTELDDIGVRTQTTGTELDDIGAPAETTGIEHDDIGIREAEEGVETRMNKADLINTLVTQKAIYVKIGDIKGESDTGSSEAKKPKEIVVVGSKIREEGVPQIDFPIGGSPETSEADTPDSFFDITYIVEEEDVQLHALAIAQHDERIEEIESSEKEVSVEYNVTIKLFGFLPVKASQEIGVSLGDEADSEGRVKVRLPWWRILGSAEVDSSALETSIEKKLKEAQYEESDLGFLRERAQTLQTISNVMKATHDTAMNMIRNMKG